MPKSPHLAPKLLGSLGLLVALWIVKGAEAKGPFDLLIVCDGLETGLGAHALEAPSKSPWQGAASFSRTTMSQAIGWAAGRPATGRSP